MLSGEGASAAAGFELTAGWIGRDVNCGPPVTTGGPGRNIRTIPIINCKS